MSLLKVIKECIITKRQVRKLRKIGIEVDSQLQERVLQDLSIQVFAELYNKAYKKNVYSEDFIQSIKEICNDFPIRIIGIVDESKAEKMFKERNDKEEKQLQHIYIYCNCQGEKRFLYVKSRNFAVLKGLSIKENFLIGTSQDNKEFLCINRKKELYKYIVNPLGFQYINIKSSKVIQKNSTHRYHYDIVSKVGSKMISARLIMKDLIEINSAGVILKKLSRQVNDIEVVDLFKKKFPEAVEVYLTIEDNTSQKDWRISNSKIESFNIQDRSLNFQWTPNEYTINVNQKIPDSVFLVEEEENLSKFNIALTSKNNLVIVSAYGFLSSRPIEDFYGVSDLILSAEGLIRKHMGVSKNKMKRISEFKQVLNSKMNIKLKRQLLLELGKSIDIENTVMNIRNNRYSIDYYNADKYIVTMALSNNIKMGKVQYDSSKGYIVELQTQTLKSKNIKSREIKEILKYCKKIIQENIK